MTCPKYVPRAILPTSPPGLVVAQWCSVSPGSSSSTRAVKPGTSVVSRPVNSSRSTSAQTAGWEQ